MKRYPKYDAEIRCVALDRLSRHEISRPKGLVLKHSMEKQMEKEELLQVYRHSLAHILAKAVIEIYGKEVQYGIGPQIEDGCYYDFVLPEGKSIGEEDFKAIENKMREIIKRREPWTRKEVSKAEAKEIFKDQKFKLELIDELPEDETISVY